MCKKTTLPESPTSLEACLLIGYKIWVPDFPFQREESHPAGALINGIRHRASVWEATGSGGDFRELENHVPHLQVSCFSMAARCSEVTT